MSLRLRIIAFLGSLQIAVPLLLTIAAVLGWGTIYEARFGTAAVQRVVYHAWWFQGLLAFLGVNLAIAAIERYPWQRRHTPFVLAHIGIILILFGGILGGRFGIDGQLIIPEGQAERILQLPGNVLIVRQPNPGIQQTFPTAFEAKAWDHEPQTTFPVTVDGRAIRLTVDRYYPDAVTDEEITDGGPADNPAVRLRLRHEAEEDETWLLARDPERFGSAWGQMHVLLMAPGTQDAIDQLLGRRASKEPARGVVTLRFDRASRSIEIPVPDERNRTVAINGTPYRLTFADYFPDFAITEQGPTSRSSRPNNPAVSFTLTGPEGVDTYLLFAFHPDVPSMHGWAHTIKVQAGYRHPEHPSLPPNSVVLVRLPSGTLTAVLSGAAGELKMIDPVAIGTWYAHPWLSDEFQVVSYFPRAQVTQQVTNRSNEVHAEALHLIGQEGGQRAEGWVGLRGTVELPLGKEPVQVEYRPAERELPFAIKLLDFRKTDYPGTQMAASFESDVQLSDPQRGIILLRTIRMNHPLRYRGFSLYQSSYVEGEVETTVLSVRNDPGTPFVYAGFLIVILGVVTMFLLRSPEARAETRSRS